jgi:glycosyltransferase involved in cell wall biosynthesis
MPDKLKILFLSQWYPFPTNNGSKIRIYNLLTNLAKSHEITLLSFADQGITIDKTDFNAFPNITKVNTIPWKPYNSNSWKAKLGFLNSAPRFITDTYSLHMEKAIRDSISQQPYDLIIASQLSMASYYSCFEEIPALFEELEIGLFHDKVVRSTNLSKRIRHNLTWLKLRRYLSELIKSFQMCTVVSSEERKLFEQHFPESKTKVEIVPNGINSSDYLDLNIEPEPNQIIFSGPFRYHVNYEAMVWFIQEIFPKILKRLPDTQLVITGDHANLPLPTQENITLTGFVPDVKPLVASSWVSIAPLLSGGGTRLKILEAMASGTPVVATSKGAQGLDIVPEKHILIADEPDIFANHVVRILKNKDLHDRLSANALQVAEEKYDWNALIPHFLQVVEKASLH